VNCKWYGSGHSLIWCTKLAQAWRDWEKTWKTSIRVAGAPWILTMYIWSTCTCSQIAWPQAFSWLAFSYEIYRVLTLGNLRFIQIIFETSVPTSQKTTAVYCGNHIQHINTLHSFLMLKQAVHTVTATLWSVHNVAEWNLLR